MKKISLMMACIFILTACGEGKIETEETIGSKEETKSVDWYQEHNEERIAKIKECDANPGELMTTANCINASRAKSASTWEARGGVIDVAPIKPKRAP